MEWRSGMFVIYCSHQWVAHRHPDPKGMQIMELRNAVLGILSGNVKVRPDIEAQLLMQNNAVPVSDELVARLRDAYVWYDYWSVPQVSLASPEEEVGTLKAMTATVRCIPEYLKRSSLFVALCPEMDHEDTGLACNYGSWLRRAWCRLELACWGLSGRSGPDDGASLVLVESASNVTYKAAQRWLIPPVGDGEFSQEKDKGLLCPVVKSLMDGYVAATAKSRDNQAILKCRFVTALEATALQGLADEDPRSLLGDPPLEEEVALFLERLNFASLADQGQGGLSALHCAALEGRPKVVEAAVRSGAAVNAKTTAFLDVRGGSTPLHLACMFGHAETVRCLLELRAQPGICDAVGCSAVHWAALHGTLMNSPAFQHHKVLEVLLDSGVSIESPSTGGFPPLLHACGWGGNAQCMQVLLERGADVRWTTPLGGPLHHVAMWGCGSSDSIALLIKYNVDVDAVVSADGLQNSLLIKGAQMALSYGWESQFCKVLGEMEGSTPLMVAAMRGHRATCKALLLHKADHHRRNASGHSALDLAVSAGYEHVATFLRYANVGHRCSSSC